MIVLLYGYFISTNAGLYNSAEALEQQTSLFLLHDSPHVWEVTDREREGDGNQ